MRVVQIEGTILHLLLGIAPRIGWTLTRNEPVRIIILTLVNYDLPKTF